MPQEKNTTLRIVVPLALSVLGVFLGLAFFRGQSGPTQPVPKAADTTPANPEAAPSSEPAATPSVTQPVTMPGTTPTAPTASSTTPATPATPAAPDAGAPASALALPLSVRTSTPTFEDPATRPLGGLDPAGQFRLEVVFGDPGNGLSAIRLADHFTTIKREAHILVQSQHPMAPAPGAPVMAPFAAVGIKIAAAGVPEQTISLIGGPQGDVWREVESTDAKRSFEATILDANAVPVVRITRTFELTKDSFDLTLTQRIDNISPVPMTVTWAQRGPVDLDREKTNYGGDKRRVRYGYLLPPEKDPSQSIVMSDKFLDWHQAVLGKREPMFGPGNQPRIDAAGAHYQGFPDRIVWPNTTSIENKYALVWAAMTDRYFAVSVHPLAPEAAIGEAKTFRWVQAIQRVVLDLGVGEEVIGLRLESKPLAIAPGASADISVGIYAGPLDRDQIAKESLLERLGLPGLVVYNFGGPCGFCTFTWLTHLLLWLLHTLHDMVFMDWALAIIFLVVIVRTCLHPLTRWSQRKMALFGKQMGAMAPKQKALQEKFKGDPAKLQAETAKLWKEEGISPTGLLGCLPAFFQMPVWIALYATLYFAVELRHQPAFYGVFQAIQPGTSPFWRFLGDLSEPDRLFYFNEYYHIPFLSGLMGPIHSINILPLILGVVFFIQQKYLTPPTTGQLTPEQEMQQKMIKVMTVVMFPFFMYNAPSGLALYFIANSSLAIIESKWIRAHMEKHGMLDLDKLKAERDRLRTERQKSGAKGGFLDRVSTALQQRMEQAQQAQQAKASGKKQVKNDQYGRKPGR